MIMNFLVMPIFFLSGALFPLANLPLAMSIITRLDPLAYGVDGLRGCSSTTGSSAWHSTSLCSRGSPRSSLAQAPICSRRIEA